MEESVNSYINLYQVTKSFMNERNEKALTNFERYLNIAIEGFSDISVFNLNTVEVAYLNVNPDTKMAMLPADFITMTKIGVKICGRLWTLTVNNDLILPEPETICPVPIDQVTQDTTTTGGFFFTPHYWYGAYYNTLYGIGGGFNTAYYRIDMNNRVIMFDGKIPNDQVILEYKSSGVKAGGALVPRQAVPALKAYLHWKTIQYDTRYSMSEREVRKQEYDVELYKLHLIETSFTAQEWLDTIYSTYSQAPKR